MVDFHSHILPDIDDGSRDYDESTRLLIEAKQAGFTKIVSTSHYAVDCFEVPEYKRKKLIDDLKQEKESLDIILGSEIFLTYNIVDLLKEYKASTINGTNYILIELPLRNSFPNLKDFLNKLRDNDYKLILAHPERYSIIHKNFNLLYDLKELGVIFQSNYGSILGIYGGATKRTVKRMFKENLISLLGSDVHRENSIYLKIPKAIEKIKKIISEEDFKKLSNDNAEIVLKGEIL